MDNRPILFNPKWKHDLDFIDWNNEWERVAEIENKLENGEPVSDEEEADRVRRHLNIQEFRFGVDIKKYDVVPKNSIPTSKECYICLKNFKINEKVIKLPCGHMFCEKCLSPWLKTNSNCPTCKFELKSDKDENEEDEEEYI